MADMKASGTNEHVCEDSPVPMDQNEGNSMLSPEEEEKVLRKKYGGMLPKKPPLISKDHERAFFDSADWALGKQGAPVEKPKGPLEALRPKLQPTSHQQSRTRRSAYASTNAEDGGNAAPEDMNTSRVYWLPIVPLSIGAFVSSFSCCPIQGNEKFHILHMSLLNFQNVYIML